VNVLQSDGELKEFLIAIDMDANLLSKIDFETGSTVLSYHLGNFVFMLINICCDPIHRMPYF